MQVHGVYGGHNGCKMEGACRPPPYPPPCFSGSQAGAVGPGMPCNLLNEVVWGQKKNECKHMVCIEGTMAVKWGGRAAPPCFSGSPAGAVGPGMPFHLLNKVGWGPKKKRNIYIYMHASTWCV